MRRLLTSLVVLVGLLGLLGGAAVAAYVGSDDTVVSTPATLGDEGQPVVTAPGLLGWDGLRITLRAEAPDGVFIGTAHPVDIEDFVGDTQHVVLESVTPGSTTTREVDGDGEQVHPEQAGFWELRQRGRDRQELALDRHDAGLQWVIAPLGGVGPTTISFAVTVAGVWRAALAVAAVGALLLVLGVELLLRLGRRRVAGRRHAPSPPGAASAPKRRAEGRRKAPRGRRQAGTRRTAARAATAAVVVVALAGCEALPVRHQSELTASTKIALTLEQATDLYASWDRRHNAVLRALARHPRRTPDWEQVERGAALAADAFGADYLRATSRRPPQQVTHTPVAVYAPRLDSYPMWAVVAARPDGTDGRQVVVQQFRRYSVTAPWLLEASTLVPARSLPDPGKAARPAEREVRAAVLSARETWAAWLADGRGSGLDVDAASTEWRGHLTELSESPVLSSVEAAAEAFGPDPEVVATADGHLALVSVRVETSLHGKKAFRVGWSPQWRALRVVDGSTLRYAHLATGLLHLPEQGRPRLLGATFREVSAQRPPAGR
ncbi:hypothetical protein DDE18_13800 [Nocardioides gansuensis]|uniref:Uncharacterized protein n=1 Tax=Nocardioides gansuensis TaxID=2138300 RepID=A0A2T8F9X1_9ACTN|nr:hypothetical protein [Nocardioides gansuensis]PVG82516.1 hypothetical protein DDE18_13800 [Nocardioides gansuensis]